MRASLGDDHALNYSAAVLTWVSFAVVYSKIILKFSAAIDPINGRAVATDAFLQDVLDRVAQRFRLFYRDRTRIALRVQFGDVQRLVGVNIAQSGDKRLVEQQWFELTMSFM